MKTQVCFNVAGVITSTSPNSALFDSDGTRLFVRPFVSVANSSFSSATPTGRICVKLYIVDVYKKLPRNSKFG